MSDIGLIKEALGAQPNEDIITVAEELDKKKARRELWMSKVGQETKHARSQRLDEEQ